MNTTTPDITGLTEETIQNFLNEMGMGEMAPVAQMHFIGKLGENIFQRIIFRIFQELPEDEEVYAKFEQLIGSHDPKAFDEFVKTYVPNYEAIIQEERDAEIAATKALLQEKQQSES